jgi:ribosomal protein S18 acetylase RimI-like enzyme
MSIRLIHLPADLDIIAELTPACFQYPENSAWSVQTDEAEGMVETIRILRKLWPLIRFGQIFSPFLRDTFLGFIWEEAGRAVGTILVQRRGTTDKWLISNVGVLPEYRRRGLARQLLQAALELIRARGGKKAILDVIDGNLPAVRLYESLGFERFSGTTDLFLPPGSPLNPAHALPDGYERAPLGKFHWKPRFEMEQRIAPATLVKYEPVEIGRFRPPAVIRLLEPILSSAQRMRERNYGIYVLPQRSLVARGGFGLSLRGKSPGGVWLRIDPQHSAVAPALLDGVLREAAGLRPGHKLECSVPGWQDFLLPALEAAGFKKTHGLPAHGYRTVNKLTQNEKRDGARRPSFRSVSGLTS